MDKDIFFKSAIIELTHNINHNANIYNLNFLKSGTFLTKICLKRVISNNIDFF